MEERKEERKEARTEERTEAQKEEPEEDQQAEQEGPARKRSWRLRTVDGEEGRAPGDRYRRGIALLPNLITTGAMFSGFFAIVAGMNGGFVAAGLAIYVAMILDAADGRVARMTSSESAFGAEYDSLSDMVAFGVAPALVAFSWALSSLGQIGWVVTFVYMACAALRLARFNTEGGDHATFTGLPSPAAAAVLASTVWLWSEASAGAASLVATIGMAVVTLVSGVLMVSNFEYFSLKVVNLRERVPFVTLVAVVFGFAVVFADPPRVLLAVFAAYALSGPAREAWVRVRARTRDSG